MIRVVHGERPDEALVDQVDALREAVVVRVDEERALDNQKVRKELSKKKKLKPIQCKYIRGIKRT